ncbi:MAG: hypothetical protein GX604_06715 [Actinobacteria bacterium]|nr:hypothetical protein [Actinomycetota bacterium]
MSDTLQTELPPAQAEAPPAPTSAAAPPALKPAPNMRELFRMWWPLAASWLLMSFEGPAISAILARLAHPEISLAAYGGLILPLCFIIEAPIIMLLSASTALSRDIQSYKLLRSFMHIVSGCLTLAHTVVAFTPIYYLVAEGLIGAPEQIVEPARVGLMLTVPWTWAIAYRRFNQGVLIRFGYSLSVGTGTVIRLSTELTILGIAFAIGSISGAAVAAATLTLGVVAEAVYAGFKVRPVIRQDLCKAPPTRHPLTTKAMLNFYIPLSLTSVLLFLGNPLVSAALSRMPEAIHSLAVWPVVGAISFIVRSFGVGFSEVVIAVIERPGAIFVLRRFGVLIAGLSLGVFLLLAAPPLQSLWYGTMVGLSPPLVALMKRYLWLIAPLPLFAVAQSYFQGTILFSRRTRAITEAVIIFLVAAVAVLVAGVVRGTLVGLPVGLTALVAGEGLRTLWMWIRSRRIRRNLRAVEPEELGSDSPQPVL